MRLPLDRTAVAIALLGMLVLAVPASAQDTVRVRGTIEKMEGDLLLIKSRDGSELKVKLAPNAGVAVTTKATMADIKQGSYIGVGGIPQPDGSQKAISVHIFHDSMRGLAEGHRSWDLQPQSTMTNATVESTVADVDGQHILLKYKDGEQKIVVPKELQIVAYVPGTAADIKVGTGIFIAAAAKQADGTLLAQRITVGKDVSPPM